ncbi:MAG: hypothetical protein HQL42_10830 [Alphaproteobacteria bacterium]|nr:hypothetical protein [Alphaproteobacteria bacterium]
MAMTFVSGDPFNPPNAMLINDPSKATAPSPAYWSAFESEDWNAALTGANRAVAIAPDDQQALFVLGYCLLRAGRISAVEEIFNHAAAVGSPTMAASVLSQILWYVLESECHGPLLAAAEIVPPDHPAAILVSYYAGCADMMTGAVDRALARFDWFADHVHLFAAHIDFFTDPRLNLVFRQARLVRGPAEVERRARIAVGPLQFRWHREIQPVGTAPILLSCMDTVYFLAFAETFAELNLAANPTSSVVFHLIGPTPEALSLLEHLATRWPGRVGGTVEDAPVIPKVTYYACARFYVVPHLLRRYHRPVVSLDAEVCAELHANRLATLCAATDFACFGTGRKEPASVWQATVMWWDDTPACHRFLDLLQHYCWPELSLPAHTNWMLDQAALLSCLHYAERTGALTFADLAVVTKKPLNEVARRFNPDEFNQNLRNATIQKEAALP